MNFFLFALPRSRSAWFSNLLTWQGSICHHEILADVDGTQGFKEAMELPVNYVGNSGSDNLMIQHWIFNTFPNARYVFLKRNPALCRLSCNNIGLHLPEEVVEMGVAAEKEIEKRGIVVDVDRLTQDVAMRVWEYCLPSQFYPFHRNNALLNMNIQINDERWEHLLKKAAA